MMLLMDAGELEEVHSGVCRGALLLHQDLICAMEATLKRLRH